MEHFTVTYPTSTTLPMPTVSMPTYNGISPDWNIRLTPTTQPFTPYQANLNPGPHWTILPWEPSPAKITAPFYTDNTSNIDPFKTLNDDEFKKEVLKMYEQLKTNVGTGPTSIMGDPLDVLKNPPPIDPTTAELLKKLLATEWAGPVVEVQAVPNVAPKPVQEPPEAQDLTGPFRRKLDLE